MTNKEVFENYSSENWVIEEALSLMLIEFMDELKHKAGNTITNNINTVGFIKKFMKDETLVHAELAEKSKMDSLEKRHDTIEDAEYREI